VLRAKYFYFVTPEIEEIELRRTRMIAAPRTNPTDAARPGFLNRQICGSFITR
jgi:hypothetical protein